MNKNIKLAVAGAVLALSATAANAGIVIPAGDWTVDIGGNVNAYTTWSAATQGSTHAVIGGLANGKGANDATGTNNSWGNGLLPNFLSIGGSTRQNDLDVSFTISIQPGSAANNALNGGTGGIGAMNTGNGGINNRQAFITFGDKSWGSVKIGKDLGVFASDAILSDMTLLGVGAGSPGGNTTLGRIGAGYIYADWKPQIAYTTPNFSGFQATAAISQNFQQGALLLGATDNVSYVNNGGSNASPAYEGKASYSFAANDVNGKIWVSGLAQRTGSLSSTAGGSDVKNNDPIAYAGDIGATLNYAGASLTGYYYSANGVGTTGQGLGGYGISATAANGVSGRDSYGGYVQATYVLPTKTKVGVSWGTSRLDLADGESATASATLVKENELWTVGVYHPLTKHLNLVAEYDRTNSQSQNGAENKVNTGSLGAILFF